MDFIEAARVPQSLQEQENFPWHIMRRQAPDPCIGFPSQTALCRWDWASLHMSHGTIVMDDSLPELRRHLPIWLAAKGRILITGLGLGCVVRGLLANPRVDHVDVVEIDQWIVDICGAEFVGNPRVTIHCADALDWPIQGRTWDYIWHDIHDNFEREDVSVTHGRLLARYLPATPIERQGAWMFPREAKRQIGRMLGA